MPSLLTQLWWMQRKSDMKNITADTPNICKGRAVGPCEIGRTDYVHVQEPRYRIPEKFPKKCPLEVADPVNASSRSRDHSILLSCHCISCGKGKLFNSFLLKRKCFILPSLPEYRDLDLGTRTMLGSHARNALSTKIFNSTLKV